MPKEETSNERKERSGSEWLAVGNSSCSLATSCAEGRVIAGCWFVKWFAWLLRAAQPANEEVITDILCRGENVLICDVER